MPPAIGAIAVSIISAGVTYAASIGVISALAAALITVGLSIATMLLFRPGKRANQGAEIRMKLDSSMPRQVATGLTATGGSLVWSYVQDVGGDVPNRFLCVSKKAVTSLLLRETTTKLRWLAHLIAPRRAGLGCGCVSIGALSLLL
jgi:hypothetical protein